MDLSNYYQQDVSFYPKMILGNISYDTIFIQELLCEMDIDITQEQILNTVISITVNNLNRQVREDTIKSFIPCLVDGQLVSTYKRELDTLVGYFIRISNEIFYNLSIFLQSSNLVFFKYINWNTGDIVFSRFELSDEQSTAFKQLSNA